MLAFDTTIHRTPRRERKDSANAPPRRLGTLIGGTPIAKAVRVMNAAADRMDPVLATFRDQVLFLKHNLNAQAVAALGNTTRDLQQDITRLIAEMEKSIREADAFISSRAP